MEESNIRVRNPMNQSHYISLPTSEQIQQIQINNYNNENIKEWLWLSKIQLFM